MKIVLDTPGASRRKNSKNKDSEGLKKKKGIGLQEEVKSPGLSPPPSSSSAPSTAFGLEPDPSGSSDSFSFFAPASQQSEDNSGDAGFIFTPPPSGEDEEHSVFQAPRENLTQDSGSIKKNLGGSGGHSSDIIDDGDVASEASPFGTIFTPEGNNILEDTATESQVQDSIEDTDTPNDSLNSEHPKLSVGARRLLRRSEESDEDSHEDGEENEEQVSSSAPKLGVSLGKKKDSKTGKKGKAKKSLFGRKATQIEDLEDEAFEAKQEKDTVRQSKKTIAKLRSRSKMPKPSDNSAVDELGRELESSTSATRSGKQKSLLHKETPVSSVEDEDSENEITLEGDESSPKLKLSKNKRTALRKGSVDLNDEVPDEDEESEDDCFTKDEDNLVVRGSTPLSTVLVLAEVGVAGILFFVLGTQCGTLLLNQLLGG